MNDRRLQKAEQRAASLAKESKRPPSIVVPDIIEFTTSDAYLGAPELFPRQATLLKIWFLQDELFTNYDLEVIGEWTESFKRTGNNGIQPDVLERLRICKSEGRHYFKEFVSVIGRRGGKNHLGAIANAYVTWRFMALGDPQGFYGLDDGQRLWLFVFAGNALQAKANQYREIRRFIARASCFAPYLRESTSSRLTLCTPRDLEIMAEESERVRRGWGRQPSIEIAAKEATAIAGRGPTAYGMTFDEMAHAVASGSNRSAEEIYESATPALDSFGPDAFLYEPSSPYSRTGKFYANYSRSLEVRDDGKPAHHQMLMCQLRSFDMYVDHERAHELPMTPGGSRFARLKKAHSTYDAEMKRLQESNPETFAVERLSHFAATIDAYLSEKKIEAMFAPWQGAPLFMTTRGVLSRTYWAHCDTSQSNANTALVIGHGEIHDGVEHAVIDLIRVWKPQDFPDHQIDYWQLEEDLWREILAFRPTTLSFDQYQSAGLISNLTHRIADANLPSRISVVELTANASRNWHRAEEFKTALGMGRVHVPLVDEDGVPYPGSELLDFEARFVQNRGGKVVPPTSGPVRTKDVLDALMEVVNAVLSDSNDAKIFASLSGVPSLSFQEWAQSGPGMDEVSTLFSQSGRRSPRYGHGAPRTRRFRGGR